MPISDPERRRLSELLQEAREEVLQDQSLPRELRALLLSRIGEMLWALDHLQVVAVGDASKAREILTKYGTVEVYDAEGKLVVPPTQNEK